MVASLLVKDNGVLVGVMGAPCGIGKGVELFCALQEFARAHPIFTMLLGIAQVFGTTNINILACL
jgi:hypothetical protein